MTIGDLPPRYQEEVARQLGNGKPLGLARAEAVRAVEVEAKPRLRQRRTPKLNKLELAWLDVLQRQHPTDRIHSQSITLQLGNGVRYTPDFVVVMPGLATEGITAYETKGRHMWDDAAVKLKVAAALYPWIKFVLVSRNEVGAWRVEEVAA
jgi:hypothetical protein